MKYIFICLMLICSASAGLSIGVGDYGLAALNIFCVFLNFYSYKQAVILSSN